MLRSAIAISLIVLSTNARPEVTSEDVPGRGLSVDPRGQATPGPPSLSDVPPSRDQCENLLRHAANVPSLKETKDYKFCASLYKSPSVEPDYSSSPLEGQRNAPVDR